MPARLVNATLLFLGLLTLTLCSGLSADEALPLAPGDPRIDGGKLQPFRTSTDWGSQTVTLGKVNGHEVINVLQLVNLPTGELLVDHIVVDRQGLGLIFRFAPYFAVGQDYLVATLRGNQLGGSLNPLTGGETLAIGKQLDSAVFEEAILGLVLATAPLEQGFRAVLPRLAISGETKQFLSGSLTVEVTGRERIKAGDKKHYDTWVVNAQWNGVDYKETLWIADRPPYLIQKTATFPNGSTRTSGFNSVTTKP